MKKLLQNFSIIAFSFVFCLGLNAQNLVKTFPSSSTSNCNGKAEIDSLNFASTHATNWYWSDTSSNVLQQGGVKFDFKCPGVYILTYSDTSNITNTFSFVIGLDTNTNNGGGTNDPCNMYQNVNTTFNIQPATDSTTCNGSIELVVTGLPANMNVNYSWNNGPTTLLNNNLCTGDYTVTMSDSNNCSHTMTGHVYIVGDTTNNNGGGTNDPCANMFANFNMTPVTDSVNCNGQIIVTVTGGKAPFTYVWDNSNNTSSSFNNLCVGNYHVTITDNANCVRQLNPYVNFAGDTTNNGGGNGGTNDPCNMYQNVNTTFNIQPATDSTTCNGSIELVVTGLPANMNVNYSWNNGPTTLLNNNLCPGDYAVTMSDSNNCSHTMTGHVSIVGDTTNNNGGGTNDPCANMFANINVIPVTDSINCNGYLQVVVTGGKAPYTYVWDNSNNTTPNYNNICVGNYHVTVTDNSNCVKQIGAYLNFAGDTTNNGGGNGGTNDPCNMYQNVNTTFNIQPATNAATCNGSVELVVNGLPANAPVSYVWSNGPTTLLNNNLCPGDYTVTMSDTNNCSQTLTAHVPVIGDTTNGGGTGNDPCANSNLNGYIFVQSVSATNICDGEVGVNLTGGKAPYSYMWNNNATSSSLTSICSGNYKVDVKDANNCQRTFTAFVGVVVDTTGTTAGTVNPCANSNLNGIVQPQFASDSLTCDGSIGFKATGGKAPYTYAWNNSATSQNLTNICTGDYQVTITDFNGCTKTMNVFVGFNGTTATIDPCANNNLQGDINSLPVTNDVNCNGSIQVYASGGKAPYSFSWNNGATSPVLQNVCNGNYTVTITDKNGCTTAVTGTVIKDLVTVVDPCANAFMNVTLTSVKTTGVNNCDGEISSTVTGGSAPYTYNWNNGEQTPSLESVCKGMYKVEVKDSNNCTFIATSYVDFTPANNATTQPLNGYVIPTAVSENGSCNGTASAIIHGGLTPYTFSYSNGATTANTANFCSGIQYLTVVDANNDTLKLDFIIASPANIITNTIATDLIDSTIVDSLFNEAISDCNIDFEAISTVTISTVTIDAANYTASVVWTVTFNDNSTIDVLNTYQILNFTSGVYNFVVQLYCPSKAIGQFVTATEAYYVAESSGSLGITETQNELNFKVYPNPFNNVLNIELEIEGKTEVILTDIVGKVVLAKTFEGHTADLDVNTLAKGQYVLTLKNEQGIKTVTLVK